MKAHPEAILTVSCETPFREPKLPFNEFKAGVEYELIKRT